MLIDDICLQAFEFSVQAALGIFSLLANVLIIQAFRKRISQVNVVYHCGKDDQKAPPSGLPPPLKSWTKLFTFVLICADFFICHSTCHKKSAPHRETDNFLCLRLCRCFLNSLYSLGKPLVFNCLNISAVAALRYGRVNRQTAQWLSPYRLIFFPQSGHST